ncbi:Uma2 family endonuclease [Kitasatospora sp. DSM 101779]|nr:Uma2 family endonuclease [Kitasatospora sp. DSM 101779]
MPDGLPVPDLLVADATTAAKATRTQGADAIVVAIEITTPSTRVGDTVLKSALYAAAGIPHYWRLELDPAPGSTSATLNAALHRPPRPGQRCHRAHRSLPSRPRPRGAAPVAR